MDLWEQSQTVDPEVRAYITSLVNAVGGSSTYDNTYSVGDDAIAVLKDLQRWLRLYDEKTNRLDVKRCLAEANLVKGDLLEILALWTDEAKDNKHKSKLALACLELLVPLTWPIGLDVENATVNHHRHVPYLQLAQVAYKRAILHHEYAALLRTTVRIGLPAMIVPKHDRSRRDEGIIKLVLYFFRNIAMITQPQHLPSQGDENEITRSATIKSFYQQDVFSLLLTIGSNAADEYQEQDVILLEILFQLLKGIDPTKLFMGKEQVADKEIAELQSLMQKEKAMVNGYRKHAPTRHNRFGTMLWISRGDEKLSTVSGQAVILDESVTLHHLDSSKKWNKPQYRGKLSLEFNEQSDFGMRVDIEEKSRKILRRFVEDFLDSSFNPLFSSLRKAIEREADRIQESVHPRQYFYLISWFLQAVSAREERKQSDCARRSSNTNTDGVTDSSFTYIAAVLDQETFVLLNRQMQRAIDTKDWQDLQATLLCFTQILLTVQTMAESKNEEDQEIAENIQNRIFYEEATHDRIVQLLRSYTHQGFAYLDTVTECAHVFMRMLERYSRQNVDLQIRSKRRARNKRKAQMQADGIEVNEENEGENAQAEEQDAYRAASERKFDFARFAAKLMTQSCVDTYIALMQYYRDLTPVQLKRCHRYLYRLAFKNELSILLFRVDILQLLHKLVKGPEGLDPSADYFKDWEQLIQQIFRRCIKWIERKNDGEGWREGAVVEMLFSKIPGTLFYLQNGYERVVEKRAPRPPAELEVRPSVPEEQRLEVAVSLLIDQAKTDLLSWVKSSLESAVEERQSWEDEQAARAATRNTEEDEPMTELTSDPASSIFLTPNTDDLKSALFKDKFLRLLLTTIGIERLGLAEDVDASWIIPSHLTSTQLRAHLTRIQQAEFNPPTFDNDKSATDLIRTKVALRANTYSDTESNADSDSDPSGAAAMDAAFPPNLREKRRQRTESESDEDERPSKRHRRQTDREPLTDAELRARAKARREKEAEKNAKIKSKLFVTDSDDESDAEKDAEFFRMEEERRRKTASAIKAALLNERVMVDQVSKKRKGNKGARVARVEDEDGDGSDREMMSESESEAEPRADPALSGDEDDEDDENEDTPSTSPAAEDGGVGERPLKEISANAQMRAADRNGIGVDEDEDEDMPVVKPVGRNRNVRAGFIIDSDSE